ncbi:MAG: HNH endonuclease signature motif containing protein [Planctomycetota bacterium]
MPRYQPHESVECAVCQREVPGRLITLHHLKPKSRGGGPDVRVPTCKTCHKQIHASFTNKELDDGFDSVGALRQSPQLKGFLSWVRKQKPDRTFSVAQDSRRPAKKRVRLAARRGSR